MTPTTALAWKTWRELRWFLFAGLALLVLEILLGQTIFRKIP